MFLNSVFSIGIGVLNAFLSEAFPKAVGVTIFGSTTQFVVAWLIDLTQNPMVPGRYQIVASVAAIAGVVLLVPHAEVVREQTAPLAAKA